MSHYRPQALARIADMKLSAFGFRLAFGMPESVQAWGDVLDQMALSGIPIRPTPRPLTMDRALPRRPREVRDCFVSPCLDSSGRALSAWPRMAWRVDDLLRQLAAS